MKRYRMNRGTSKRLFKNTARGTHPKNVNYGSPMRGGIRL